MNRLILIFSIAYFVAAPPLSGEEPYKEDFESYEIGKEPDLFILDGTFTVEAQDDGNKVLQLAASPLVEGSIQLGSSLKKGGEITARIKGLQRRRSYPRFGVGLHGISGYRLRITPAKKALELVKGGDGEVIESTPIEWRSGQWHYIKLEVQLMEEGQWAISGWTWAEGEKEPEKPLITILGEKRRLQGKGSITGTPYSGEPILFDDVVVKALD